ncbi:Purine nucleoside permease (NUP) [Lacunisphaera limnophila]|uniref:Purine nucleoside permease (NUP) n=1 Tax=Lacunisphaera limnophila TaxID=1838286 RepID=A0A1D8ATS5_9BACT|nr:purine nucleoside permease [Lacunisphaera limnophila]AOS44305.1 Purine nucleoside permease (NUP) [Lacunisphaera limnophila]
MVTHPPFRRLAASLAFTLVVACPAAEVLRPKVVVVAMFEQGNDIGDAPGEFQFWVEREKLDRVIPLPAGYRDLRANADGSVLGIVTGMGNTNAASSIMALGLDPRFDLSKSYWLVAGIAGLDPADASAGSAVWTDYAVEGDLGHEIDAREIPADWKTGYIPIRKKTPYATPMQPAAERVDNAYALNPGLLQWAYALTKNTPLQDTESVQGFRARYQDHPKALQPPSVLIGSNLASSTYWHGKLLNQWANDWVAYYTEGRGNYVTTAMEDTGTLRALTNLTRAGRADVNRVLVLRTASNHDMQPPGLTAAQSLAGEGIGHYSAFIPSLEAAHAVGSQVVHALVKGWDRYETEIPSAAPQP